MWGKGRVPQLVAHCSSCILPANPGPNGSRHARQPASQRHRGERKEKGNMSIQYCVAASLPHHQSQCTSCCCCCICCCDSSSSSALYSPTVHGRSGHHAWLWPLPFSHPPPHPTLSRVASLNWVRFNPLLLALPCSHHAVLLISTSGGSNSLLSLSLALSFFILVEGSSEVF